MPRDGERRCAQPRRRLVPVVFRQSCPFLSPCYLVGFCVTSGRCAEITNNKSGRQAVLTVKGRRETRPKGGAKHCQRGRGGEVVREGRDSARDGAVRSPCSAPRAPARYEDGWPWPPHHLAAEHIEHDGQVQQPRPGRHVGDVGHPDSVRCIGCELTFDPVRSRTSKSTQPRVRGGPGGGRRRRGWWCR